MKMRWWGWIGIAVILYGAKQAQGDHIVSAPTGDVATIGIALSIYPYSFLYACAGILIWLSARNPRTRD